MEHPDAATTNSPANVTRRWGVTVTNGVAVDSGVAVGTGVEVGGGGPKPAITRSPDAESPLASSLPSWGATPAVVMVATPTSRAAGSRNCSQLKARIVPRKLFGRGTLVAPVPPGVVPGVHSESKEATNAVVLDGMLTA